MQIDVSGFAEVRLTFACQNGRLLTQRRKDAKGNFCEKIGNGLARAQLAGDLGRRVLSLEIGGQIVSIGPGGEAVIPIEVDYSREFGPTDRETWKAEYQSNIKPGSWTWSLGETYGASPREGTYVNQADDWLDTFEEMDAEDRRFVIDELAARPDLWGEESEGAPW